MGNAAPPPSDRADSARALPPDARFPARKRASSKSKLSGFALHLENRGLMTLPSDLPSNLTDLHCGGNKFSSLQPLASLARLSHLQALDFSRNQLSSLEPISKLMNLTRLCCSANPISSLQPISRLSCLIELDVQACRVTSLEPLMGLSSLTKLNCGSCSVSTLEPLRLLTALTVIDCAFNPLTSLLPLTSLSHLSTLVCPARLRDFYVFCEALPDVDVIEKDGTLTSLYLSQQTASDETQQLPFQYLPALRSDDGLWAKGEVRWPSVKVHVLGDAGHGKTSLIRWLVGEEVQREAREETHGVEIWDIEAREDVWQKRSQYGIDGSRLSDELGSSNPRFYVWDFAGQEEYYSTHHVFLSEGGIYVLVIKISPDLALNTERVRFWLDSIRAYSPRSEILVIGTHGDQLAGNRDEKEAAISEWKSHLVSLLSKERALSASHPMSQGGQATMISVISCLDSDEQQRLEVIQKLLALAPPKFIPRTYVPFFDSLSAAAVGVPLGMLRLDSAAVATSAATAGVSNSEVRQALSYFAHAGLVFNSSDCVFLRPHEIVNSLRLFMAPQRHMLRTFSSEPWLLDDCTAEDVLRVGLQKNYTADVWPAVRGVLLHYDLAFVQPGSERLILPLLMDATREKATRAEAMSAVRPALQNNTAEVVPLLVVRVVPAPLGLAGRLIAALQRTQASDYFWSNGCGIKVEGCFTVVECEGDRISTWVAPSQSEIRMNALQKVARLVRTECGSKDCSIASLCCVACEALVVAHSDKLEQLQPLCLRHQLRHDESKPSLWALSDAPLRSFFSQPFTSRAVRDLWTANASEAIPLDVSIIDYFNTYTAKRAQLVRLLLAHGMIPRGVELSALLHELDEPNMANRTMSASSPVRSPATIPIRTDLQVQSPVSAVAISTASVAANSTVANTWDSALPSLRYFLSLPSVRALLMEQLSSKHGIAVPGDVALLDYFVCHKSQRGTLLRLIMSSDVLPPNVNLSVVLQEVEAQHSVQTQPQTSSAQRSSTLIDNRYLPAWDGSSDWIARTESLLSVSLQSTPRTRLLTIARTLRENFGDASKFDANMFYAASLSAACVVEPGRCYCSSQNANGCKLGYCTTLYQHTHVPERCFGALVMEMLQVTFGTAMPPLIQSRWRVVKML